MAYRKGTILVAKNRIRCHIPGFLFEPGTEFKYIGSYNGSYLVEKAVDGKVYPSDSHIPTITGTGGCVLAVMPCDVEKKKDILEILIEEFKNKWSFAGREVKVPNPPITIRDTEGFHASGSNGYMTKLRINPNTGKFEYWHDWWSYGWFDDDQYRSQKISALKQVLGK